MVMQHIFGKLSTSTFQRYKFCTNRSLDGRVMAPGSRGAGAVFACFSGEDSGQTGEATGEPRVARRSWSRYLSNAPGPAGQLAASWKDSACEGRFWICGKSELGFAIYGSANGGRRSVFGPLGDVFPIEIPARPGKILAIREFHTMHERVLFPTYLGLRINSLRVRKTLRASVRPLECSLCQGVIFRLRFRLDRRKLLTIRELHIVAEATFLLKGFSSRTKLLRVGKSLCANDASQIGCFVNNTQGRSVRSSFWSGQRSGQTSVNLRSNLVKLGQSSPNFGKCILDHVLRVSRYSGPRSGQKWLGQTSVKLGQLRSNLVNPGQTWSNFGKCAPDLVLRLFDVASPRWIRPTWFGLPRFACRHPRKSRGIGINIHFSLCLSFKVKMKTRERVELHWRHRTVYLVSIPDGLGPEDERNERDKLCEAILLTMPEKLEELIININNSNGDDDKISCIVADAGMGWALEAANKMGIKGVIYWPASTASLALQLSIPRLIDDGIINCEGNPTSQKIFFQYTLRYMQAFKFADWWLCNTVHELESVTFSLSPKVLPIGPLISSKHTEDTGGQFWQIDHSCLNWLDQQPPCSVVYVAFGSFTVFDPTQFQELAIGLELTNRPFLWVVRPDIRNGSKTAYTKEFQGTRGKIVEGLSNGVPFLCWPYFDDQFLDQSYICDVWKVGLGFEQDEDGIILREEIKGKVDQLLGDANIRARSLELKKMLVVSLAADGAIPLSLNLSRLESAKSRPDLGCGKQLIFSFLVLGMVSIKCLTMGVEFHIEDEQGPPECWAMVVAALEWWQPWWPWQLSASFALALFSPSLLPSWLML
uniref:UDP-glycosyltransferases domain-containing protein n=1 Tax=Fagus sylvatica TaxID=28930 RepID=A0A2N9HJ11_FAGSY